MITETKSRLPESEQRESRSLTDLLRELRDESATLIRQEISLAKTELSEKAGKAARNTTYIGIGGAIANAGLLLLLIGLTAGLYAILVALDLSHMTAGWLSPLIMGGLLAALGYGFIQKGISTLKNESAVPERTLGTLQEDKEWAKEKVQ